MEQTGQAIEALLDEQRLFEPPPAFRAAARVRDESIYAEADKDPAGWWKARALEELEWFEEPSEGLDYSNPPFAKWFVGGTSTLAYNCLDRHLRQGAGDKAAYIWEGEPGDSARLTYASSTTSRSLRERAQGARRAQAAIASRSTCGMVPERRSRCSRARASARRTPSSSAASRRRARRPHQRRRSARCSITADGGWRRGNDRAAQGDRRRRARADASRSRR